MRRYLDTVAPRWSSHASTDATNELGVSRADLGLVFVPCQMLIKCIRRQLTTYACSLGDICRMSLFGGVVVVRVMIPLPAARTRVKYRGIGTLFFSNRPVIVG